MTAREMLPTTWDADRDEEFFRITEHANNIFKKAGSDLLHLRTDELPATKRDVSVCTLSARRVGGGGSAFMGPGFSSCARAGTGTRYRPGKRAPAMLSGSAIRGIDTFRSTSARATSTVTPRPVTSVK